MVTDTPKWKQDAEWDVFTPPGETLSFVRCDGVIVAACSTTGKDDHKENAALFAAADDLYKALEGFVNNSDLQCQCDRREYEAAESALKKARGIK